MEYICSLLAQWCPLNNSKTSRCPLQWGVPFPHRSFPQHYMFPISYSHSFVIMTDMISFSIYKMSIPLLSAGHFLLSCHCLLLSMEALVAPKVSISVPWLQSLSRGMCEELGTILPQLASYSSALLTHACLATAHEGHRHNLKDTACHSLEFLWYWSLF